jgi:type I restriction-modification system DNA methylase subunit
LTFWGERALPNLGANIKCGNSLIGPDYFEAQLMPDEEEVRRVNPFDWSAEFSETAAGRAGFDCIIGNPPYIRIQTLPKADRVHYNERYQVATGNYDIYVLFVELGWDLLRQNGLLGFILPHRFFKTSYGEGLRGFLAERQNLREILDFDGYMVFEGASINTCILILGKESEDKFKFGQARFIQSPASGVSGVLERVRKVGQLFDEDVGVDTLEMRGFAKEPWVFLFPHEETLWERLNSTQCRLSNAATRIFQGLKTGGDTVFSLRAVSEYCSRTRKANSFQQMTCSGSIR